VHVDFQKESTVKCFAKLIKKQVKRGDTAFLEYNHPQKGSRTNLAAAPISMKVGTT
jgi:hypothetical protein